MRIRRLRADELATFVDDLWLPFARETAAMDDFDALAERGVRREVHSYVTERFSNDDVATYVADDEPVGFVAVEKRSSPPVFARGPRGYVDGLYVAPERRRERIASHLLARAEAWARRRGCDHLSLDVHPENEVARSLYEDGGFETTRHRMTKGL